MTITNEPDLSGREAYLASKECESDEVKILNADAVKPLMVTPAVKFTHSCNNFPCRCEEPKTDTGIDWAEFDKQDQIIFSSNE